MSHEKGKEQLGKSGASAPISEHPLFTAIVASWFAALLGLGSLVLPAQLLEHASTSSGLAALIPAAAPPLGITARILIAATGAVVGAASGLLLARTVVSRQNSQRRPSHLAARAFQPAEHLFADFSDAPETATIEKNLSETPREDAEKEESWLDTLLADATVPDLAPVKDHASDVIGTNNLPPEGGKSERLENPPSSAIAQASEKPRAVDTEFGRVASAGVGEEEASGRQAEVQQVKTPASNLIMAKPVFERPLGQLGMTELVERLAHAISQREFDNGAVHSPATDAPPDEAPVAAPLDRVPLESPAHAWSDTDEIEEDEEEDVDAEWGYGSLLSMQKSPSPPVEYAGVEELQANDDMIEPMVIFPGRAARRAAASEPAHPALPANPDTLTRRQTEQEQAAGTEHALRTALANLQRFSGAA